MSAVINTNIAAIRTHNVYNKNNDYMNQALTRVSTGMKVNSAKDGGSVWAISEKMRERIRANDQANQNVQNDNALLKTAEGGVSNTIDILKTLKERAVNAANDSNMTVDRNILQVEVDQLINQINDNAAKVKFNGRTLLNGSAAADSSATATSSTVEVPGTAATQTTYSSAITLKANSGANGTDFITDDAIISKISNSSPSADNEVAVFVSGVSLVTDNDGTDTAFSTANKIQWNQAATKWYYNQSSNATVYVKTAGTAATAASTDTVAGTGTVPSSGNNLNFHIGGESDFTMTFTMESMTANSLLGSNSIVVTTVDDAKAAITSIDSALEKALKFQTKLGAYENRLGYTSDNLTTMNENLEAADSVMRDSDIAKEMTNYMKYAVLSQASQYMLAQAGQNAFSVLNLLQA